MNTTTDSRPSIASLLTTDIRFGHADLHVETSRGEGSASLPQILGRIERRAELDVVAIADREVRSASRHNRPYALAGIPTRGPR